LKKGETLVNIRTNGNKTGKKSDQAVVLTLRNRYSIVRRGARRLAADSRAAIDGLLTSRADSNGGEVQASPVDDAAQNPWNDVHSGPSRRPPTSSNVAHRLSFDYGSGVIMLPDDDGEWLEHDADSESDDYGTTNEIESTQNLMDTETAAAADVISPASEPESHAGVPKRRFGTYYHHPERRRRTVSGTFSSTSRS